MSKRLTDNITSKYFEAANKMRPQKARRRIVAYVESYDDIFFWRTVLGRYEDATRYFEIMLPTRETHLERGKKAAIEQLLSGVGRDMIACVDADYDYLRQQRTPLSQQINNNPYVLHTYVYAIENYQCYAPGLHNACVMVTLNDRDIFNFESYLTEYSRIIYPLFIWNLWINFSSSYGSFTIGQFNQTIEISRGDVRHTDRAFAQLRGKVERKVRRLEREYPQFAPCRDAFIKEMAELGLTPDNTYLFVQGHHLFDNVVLPVVARVCDRLVRERQEEIRRQSVHHAQEQTEMACYKHSIQDVAAMMKKNTSYEASQPFARILRDVEHMLALPEQEKENG